MRLVLQAAHHNSVFKSLSARHAAGDTYIPPGGQEEAGLICHEAWLFEATTRDGVPRLDLHCGPLVLPNCCSNMYCFHYFRILVSLTPASPIYMPGADFFLVKYQ